jgi:hypothetical protein
MGVKYQNFMLVQIWRIIEEKNKPKKDNPENMFNKQNVFESNFFWVSWNIPLHPKSA